MDRAKPIIKTLYYVVMFGILSNLIAETDHFMLRLLYSTALVLTGFYIFETSDSKE
ncbi:MAG: hypothetical protein SPI65_01490 [Peptoniphilus sp.]|nr:hypothetical protein [Peptoniphilus sp.]MDD7362997.1 hypothetical protein [Bacillota bacterium]MDY6044237.1 hypothetical protein [Peptoniphilus sp.]